MIVADRDAVEMPEQPSHELLGCRRNDLANLVEIIEIADKAIDADAVGEFRAPDSLENRQGRGDTVRQMTEIVEMEGAASPAQANVAAHVHFGDQILTVPHRSDFAEPNGRAI